MRPLIARQWFAHLGLEAKGDDALAKVTIVRPAQQAVPMRAVEAKWAAVAQIRVLFCGREFDGKNGLVALHVMREVMDQYPDVEFCYVGPIPDHVQSASPRLLERIIHFDHLDRHAMLEQMALAHILFHPSKHECIGNVLLEAMAAGAAVVTAVGESTEYAGEFFEESGGALLLDRSIVPAGQECQEFARLLLGALGDRGRLRAMGFDNHREMVAGKYSVFAQCEALGHAYERLHGLHGPVLDAVSLAATRANVIELTSAQLTEDMRRARQHHQVPSAATALVL